MADRVLASIATIDVLDKASPKLVAIARKVELLSKAWAAAGKTSASFDRFERALGKVDAASRQAARSGQDLARAFDGVDRRAGASIAAAARSLDGLSAKARSAATGTTQALGKITTAAGTTAAAIERMARAQGRANTASARAARLGRSFPAPVAPVAPPRTPTPPGGRMPTPPGGRTPPQPPGPHGTTFGRVAEGWAGERAVESITTRSAEAGAELERQRVDTAAAGMTLHEQREAEERALALSRKYPTVPQTASMRMIRNARAATGDMEDALSVMDPLTKLRVLAQAKKPGVDVSGEFEQLIKGLEIKGVAQHPDSFMRYMNGLAKAINTFGEQVSPSSYYQMFKYGRGSTRGLSEDYMLSVAPTLAAELGGSSTGVAQSAFYQAIIGRRLKASSMAELETLGLLHEDRLERDQKGNVKHIGAGGIVGADLARADPYKWVNQILLPALAKKGITEQGEVTDHIASIFGNALAQQLVSILATQQQRIEKDRRNIAGAHGLEAADEYLERDPHQALGAFNAQLENLLANASSPLMPAATAALRGLADVLGSLSEKAKEHPVAAPAALGATTLFAGWGAMWGVRKILGLLGVGRGAAAATGGAAAGGAGAGAGFLARWLPGAGRVARMGRLGTPLGLVLAALDVLAAGYEAADDTGRTHPYGAPGSAWKEQYERNRAGNRLLVEERNRADARRAWREGTLLEQYPDRGFHGDPRGPVPIDRLADLVPATTSVVGQVSGPAGNGTADDIRSSLDESAGKIAAALNGQAQVTIRVDAGPDLVAKIVGVVKREMSAFSLTGVGSNGRSDADVDRGE